jgi:hypothetical protein
MKFGRREFLHLAAGAVATATSVPSMDRGQGQALKRRPARDRLEGKGQDKHGEESDSVA